MEMFSSFGMVDRALLLAALVLGPAWAQDRAAKVDAIFAEWNKPDSPGCALSVMQDGRIVYKRAYGMADLDHDAPLTPASVFHVASISKQFTAASIVLLAQDGKLSLDDEARKYVPELPDFGAPITLRHLIHHSSGLRDQWTLLGLAGWRYSLDLITDDDVLDLVSRQKELNFRPGDEHVYCNTGYTLLAQIVKRVSGRSMREFADARIFDPLGMKKTHFRDDHAEIVKNQAYGYKPASGKTFRLSVTNFDTVGATSLLTTVEDLALWDENFYHPKVGGPAFLAQMLERGKLNSGLTLNYAFGLSHGKYKGLVTVDHSGSDAGYRADLLRFPEQHFSVACLCNLATISPAQLTRKVADVYLGDSMTEPKAPGAPDRPLTSEQISRYPGLYWSADTGGVRRVGLTRGTLRLMSPEKGTYELKPLGPDRFQLADTAIEARFSSPEAGGKLRLTETTPGAAMPEEVFEFIIESAPTETKLREYAGDYLSNELGAVYRFDAQSGKLSLRRPKSKAEPLEPVAPDVFRGSVGNIRFTRDPDGRVSGFAISSGRVRNLRFRKEGA